MNMHTQTDTDNAVMIESSDLFEPLIVVFIIFALPNLNACILPSRKI